MSYSKKNMSYNNNKLNSASSGISRIGPKDFRQGEKEIAALIITISSGSSYDSLYQSMEQTPPDPEQYVSVISMSQNQFPTFLTLLRNIENPPEFEEPLFNELAKEIKQLDGENVVLNFECCSGCSNFNFGSEESNIMTMEITKIAIDRKFICMFSDFSLKALISVWDENKLGANPFKIVGEFSSSFKLEFNVQKLIDCSFAQLQNVGELCEKGLAVSHAMGGTILYTVNDTYQEKTPPYNLTILTIVTEADSKAYSSNPLAITLDEKKGLAGHVVLEYQNGGTILTSCGHWIELVKLDVSMESVLSHAQKKYGDAYANNLSVELNTYSGAERDEQLRFISNNYVQKSAPCKYQSKKFVG